MKVVLSCQEGTPINDVEKALKTGVLMVSYHEDSDQEVIHANVGAEMMKRDPAFTGEITHFVFPIPDEVVLSAFAEYAQNSIDQAMAPVMENLLHNYMLIDAPRGLRLTSRVEFPYDVLGTDDLLGL